MGPANLIGCLIATIYAVPTLWYPFGADQGAHAYLGDSLLQGLWPYAEGGASNKPIGIHLVHAFHYWVFGKNQWGLRVVDLFTLLLIGFIVARMVETKADLRDGLSGAAAIITVGVYHALFDFWHTSQPELWEGLFLIAAALVAARSRRVQRGAFVAGALAGLGFLFKFPGALVAIGIAVLCMSRAREVGRWRGALVAGFVFSCGALLVVVASVLPFVIAGHVDAIWRQLVVDLWVYVKDQPSAPLHPANYFYHATAVLAGPALVAALIHGASLRLLRRVRTAWSVCFNCTTSVACVIGFRWFFSESMFEWMAPFSVVFAAAGLAASIGVRSRNREQRTLARVIYVLCGLAFASMLMQRLFFPYHMVVMTPFLAAMFVLAVHRIWGGRPFAQVGAALVLLVASCAAQFPRPDNANTNYAHSTGLWWQFVTGGIERDVYLDIFRGPYGYNYRNLESMGREIRQVAVPGDTLCVRNFFASPLYAITGLRCPSRHSEQAWLKDPQMMETAPPTFLVGAGGSASGYRQFRPGDTETRARSGAP